MVLPGLPETEEVEAFAWDLGSFEDKHFQVAILSKAS